MWQSSQNGRNAAVLRPYRTEGSPEIEEDPAPAAAEPVHVPEPEPADEKGSAAAGSTELWEKVLADLSDKTPIGTCVLMKDSAMVTGERIGSELVLHIVPGFQGDQIRQAGVINQIRQSATRLAGQSILVRVEDKKNSTPLSEDKLDKLGQFSNVIIR